ncbi:MAG: hypothetical protein J5740_01780 [Bacteroidales bacterium]|nr:hypothetical protein [Bacteroidales bacterium]
MAAQVLYICYSINDFFAREAGISLIGFFENNPDYEPEEVFILDYGIHPLNKERLDGIAGSYGRRITYLKAKAVTDVVRREFPNLKAWRGSMAPNAKAFVEQIFPDYVHRLLFIDADTVVAGSVAELGAIDMERAAMGAIPLNWVTEDLNRKRLELYSGNTIYFNSGVLLYNLDVWRSENCHQMIVDTLHKKKRLKWPDQTLLNNAIPERLIVKLPPKYNYVTHYIHPRQERGWMRQGHVYSNEEIEEAINHPAIIHYVGGWPHARPWCEDSRTTHAEEYFRYKAMSPWRDTPLYPPQKEPSLEGKDADRRYLWLLGQLQKNRPFALVWLMSRIYYCTRMILSPFRKKRPGDDIPSEGKEAIDNE